MSRFGLKALLAGLAVGLWAVAASAQTLYVTEPFTYPVSSGTNLNGLGTATNGWAGSWALASGSTGTIVTSSTGLPYSNLQTSGRSVTATGTQDIYTRSISAASSPSNDYWLSFTIRTNAGNNQYAGIDLGGNRYIGKASADTTYGIAVTGSAPDVTGNTSVPSGLSTTDLLVAHFRSDNNIDLYVNPTSLGGAAPSTASASAALSTPTLSGTALRLFSGSINGAAAPTTFFSDIRIGDSFAAVTPVPEPMTVGLVAVAALGLLRRRIV